jgi:hypothetical protein
VLPTLDTGALRRELAERYDFAQPVSAESLLEDLGKMLAEGLVHATHPRYFGLGGWAVSSSTHTRWWFL